MDTRRPRRETGASQIAKENITMSASQKNTEVKTETQDALVFVDGKPHYELNAETLRILLVIPVKGKQIPLLSTLRPYRNPELIAMIKEREGHMEPAKDELGAFDLKRPPTAIEQRFFDRHKISVTHLGKELSESALEQANLRYGYKAGVINQGLNAIFSEIEEEAGDVDLEALLESTEAEAHYHYLADEQGQEHRIDMGAHFSPVNAQSNLDWERCLKVRNLAKGAQKVNYLYERVDALFDRDIQAYDGFSIDGKPCEAPNKDKWAQRVPYFFKQYALIQRFRNVQRKNS
ncbi:MAG: hypothetical protein ACRD1R_20980 [Acidobacteriota bacterium]